MNPIRLVVVDDHALFRAGLIGLLKEMNGFEIVGEAGNGREAIEIIRTQKPDVVLLDVNMPVMNGIETVRMISDWKQNDLKNIHILMLTISKHEQDLFDAIEAGAEGYLLKNIEPDELRKAIFFVVEGKGTLSPDVTQPLMRAFIQLKNQASNNGLSRREVDILECLALGLTTAQVAQKLFISENTVKTHIRHIFEKLKAANRVEAVRIASQRGIIRTS